MNQENMPPETGQEPPRPEINRQPSSETQSWLIGVHLSALAAFIIPFGNILGPLVIWLIKREQMPEVDIHGKAVLNFQISLAIYFIIAAFTIIILIGFVLAPLVALFGLIMTIIGAVKASQGELFKYPLSIPFLK